MENVKGEKFKLNLDIRNGVKLQVLGDPEPYTKENKSKWKIVNWYRKLRGTYYESGYSYKVKLVK